MASEGSASDVEGHALAVERAIAPNQPELLFDEEERLCTRGGMGSSEAHKEGDGAATSYGDRVGHGSVDPRRLERDRRRGDPRRRSNDRVRSESQYRVSAHDDGVLYSPGT